ncbi:2-hydroxyacid dehydrogenase [Virgibacillus byunsanensis]|uniref:2-hydroxyacid dehydrogenase n=1 Tax=Virgibacillus byunsanensis TaxID=570945 RepID=A0ABW3LR59_9BACI
MIFVEKAIYFDDISNELKKIVLKNKPIDLEILFWNELSDVQKDQETIDTDYFILTAFQVDDKLLRKAKSLKFIQKVGIGVDNIDLNTAERLSIPVSNTPGGNSISVAELTILFILTLYRRLVEIDQRTKAGNWDSWKFRSSSFELNGKIHGLIGMGNIGLEAAKRSSSFGTKIVYYDTRRLSKEKEREVNAEYMSLDKVLQTSDIVSLHVPLIPQTRNIINKEKMKQMKRNAILINVARGGIVNEADLYECLSNQTISGAAIDAWETEPIPKDNKLLLLDNVVATPHIGGGTADTFNRVINMGFENIKRVRKGKAAHHIVNNFQVKDHN